MVDKDERTAPDADERQFSKNMQKMRERLGWSQTELARRMVEAGWSNYNQMTVSRTEKGERPIRLSEARALAQIFGDRVEAMTDSDERFDVGLALKETSAAYDALAEATKAFLMAQNLLAIRADSASVTGETVDTDAIEDWLQTSPESVISDAVFSSEASSRADASWDMRHLGLSSMAELEQHQQAEAANAGFDTYEEYEQSLTPHLKFIVFLRRARSGKHPEEG